MHWEDSRMSNFIIYPREFDNVPNLLLSEVSGFAQSTELSQLNCEELKIPGVVCAAFAKYFVRRQEAVLNKSADVAALESLASCYAVIEKMACSGDPSVNNLLV